MKNLYTEKVLVDDTQIGFDSKLTITEIIRLMQVATFNHSNLLGLSHQEMLDKSNAFWVVTKLKLVLLSDINSGEKLTLRTWTHTPSMIRFDRECEIKLRNKKLAKARVEWCCLDYTTGRPRKASSIVYPELEMVENANNNIKYSTEKVELGKEDFVYTRVVRSMDIDVNLHTNNLKYNFMALDCFSVEELKSMKIKEYEISFVNQSYEGDHIDVYRKKVKDTYFIEGKKDDKVIFRVVIKFKKI